MYSILRDQTCLCCQYRYGSYASTKRNTVAWLYILWSAPHIHCISYIGCLFYRSQCQSSGIYGTIMGHACCIVGIGSDDDVLTTGSEGANLWFSYIASLSKQFTTLIKAYRMFANLLLTILLDILSKWQD